MLLKFFTAAQFLLILFNKEKVDSTVYLITEIVFKLSLGIFIEYILFHNDVIGMELEDKIILSFAGGLLIYDAYVNNLTDLLK